MKINFTRHLSNNSLVVRKLWAKNAFIFLFVLLCSFNSFAQKDSTEVLQTAVLKGIWFTDNINGYAVGYNGTILKTTDGGVSWKTLSSGVTNSLFSVSFSNVNNGLICGANGIILKTNDGGATWETRPSGTIVTLHEVFFLDSANAYISGQFGTYLKSTDAGETWSSISISPGKSELATPSLAGNPLSGSQANNAITLHNITQVKNKDSLVSVNINILEDFWKKYNYLSTRKQQFETTAVIPDLYKVRVNDTIVRSDYANRVNEAKIKQVKNDFGLSAVGNFQENSSGGIGDDEMVFYRRRAQAGLDWDILGNGYLKSRYNKQILENEIIINSLKPETRISSADFIIISHKIIYAFNQHKIKLLEQRQQIINDKIDAANELYLLKHLPKLELMQIIQQQVDVSSMFQIYQAYNEQLTQEINTKNIPVNILPVFDLDPEKIGGFNTTSATGNDSIMKLKIKNLELANSAWTDVSLRTTLRYNWFNFSGLNRSDRYFLSAGLSFSVPLPMGFKADKNSVAVQSDLIRFDQRNSSEQKNVDLLNTIYEFRYKLKQYNNFYEKHKKYEELLRIERVKEKLQYFEFNPIAALNLLDEMLSVEVEMLDIQQEMYLSLLDIITKTPGTNAITVIQPIASAQQKDADPAKPASSLMDETKERSIYIWSEALTKYSDAYIEEYLNYNNIKTAIVSIGDVDKDKANKLFGVFKASGITTEFMIGSNKLLFNPNPAAHLDSITKGLDWTDISALHLDVEPHALDDWDKNKDSHLAKYVNLLKQAKVYCQAKNIKLHVSIPVYYPEATLTEIYAAADKVYIMAYEHTDAFFIMKKVKEEFTLSAEKSVIAIRAKDFATRSAFEKFLNELSLAMNTKTFALHDLETFIKLDELNSGEINK